MWFPLGNMAFEKKKKSTFPSFTGRQLAFLRRSQDLHPSRLVKQILKVKR